MYSLGSKVFIEFSSEEGLCRVRQSVWAETGKNYLCFSPNSFSPQALDSIVQPILRVSFIFLVSEFANLSLGIAQTGKKWGLCWFAMFFV